MVYFLLLCHFLLIVFLLKYFRKTIHLPHRKICHLCCHWCFIVRMFDRFVICYGFCCVVDEPTL